MNSQVFGYHGTTRTKAAQILAEGFRHSRNPWEWLGDGVYFWQDAPERARLWGLEWSKRKQGPVETAVLKCSLRLADCLDLLDVRYNEVVRDVSKAFLAQMPATGMLNLRNHRVGSKAGRHELDSAFFNHLVARLSEKGMDFRSLRAAFSEGEPILPDSPICYRSHVQICIRDLSLIEDVELL